jgi:hypothetical protein
MSEKASKPTNLGRTAPRNLALEIDFDKASVKAAAVGMSDADVKTLLDYAQSIPDPTLEVFQRGIMEFIQDERSFRAKLYRRG